MTSDLPIAVRVYPDLPSQPSRETRLRRSTAMLVFDCETRTDKAQALTFGSYRFLVEGRCLEEGLFYGDDSAAARARRAWNATSRSHRSRHRPARYPGARYSEQSADLQLLSARGVPRRCSTAWRTRAAGCSSRSTSRSTSRASRWATRPRKVASWAASASSSFSTGIAAGTLRPNPYRPAITVKHMDSKRSFKRFTATIDRDKEDRIPEGAASPKPDDRYIFRGHMLDAKTLAFALTDQGMSLERACELFGVEHGKQKVKRHGVVTPKYIDYNRRDVLATCELTEKLLAEYALHPIPLQATKAYSAASIGKAYLEAMGVTSAPRAHAGLPEAVSRLCRIGVLRRACERARAQSSRADRLHRLYEPVFHGECADGALELRDCERDYESWKMPARSSQRSCET